MPQKKRENRTENKKMQMSKTKEINNFSTLLLPTLSFFLFINHAD
jgi:hypothetical protein